VSFFDQAWWGFQFKFNFYIKLKALIYSKDSRKNNKNFINESESFPRRRESRQKATIMYLITMAEISVHRKLH